MEHIRLVAEPPAEPGLKACIVTGAVKGPFVSLGFGQRHDDGWLLLSAKIGEYVAKAIGWVPVDEAQQLRDDLAAARAENDQLEERLRAAGIDAERVQDADRLLDAFGVIVAVTAKHIDTPPPLIPGSRAVTAETF